MFWLSTLNNLSYSSVLQEVVNYSEGTFTGIFLVYNLDTRYEITLKSKESWSGG